MGKIAFQCLSDGRLRIIRSAGLQNSKTLDDAAGKRVEFFPHRRKSRKAVVLLKDRVMTLNSAAQFAPTKNLHPK